MDELPNQRNSREILTLSPPAADARIEYGSEPLQFADFRAPAGHGPWPLAIVVHGGSWQANYNLIHAGHLCVALSECGFATWNVEYRRVGDPGGGWPGTLHDVLQAVEYTCELQKVDQTRTVLVGHSAGGHLALLAGAQLSRPVVAIAAVSDLELWTPEVVASFLGDANPRVASPTHNLPLGVQQLLIHGTEDDQVPYWLSERYVRSAREAGDFVKLVTLRGDGHFEPIDPRSSSWPHVEAAIRSMVGLTTPSPRER